MRARAIRLRRHRLFGSLTLSLLELCFAAAVKSLGLAPAEFSPHVVRHSDPIADILYAVRTLAVVEKRGRWGVIAPLRVTERQDVLCCKPPVCQSLSSAGARRLRARLWTGCIAPVRETVFDQGLYGIWAAPLARIFLSAQWIGIPFGGFHRHTMWLRRCKKMS